MAFKSPTAEEQLAISSGNNQLQAFLQSLVFNLVLGVFLFLFFCFLRPRYPRTFSPKTIIFGNSVLVQKTRGIFTWLKPILFLDHRDLLEHSGVDAYCIVRFLFVVLRLFGFFALIVPATLIPLNAINQQGFPGLDSASIANLKDKVRVWGHSIALLLISICTLYTIVKEYQNLSQIRQGFLTSPDEKNRTIMVTSLPNDLKSQTSLTLLFNSFPGGIEKLTPCKKLDQLKTLVKQRQASIFQLEAFLLKLIIFLTKEGVGKKIKISSKWFDFTNPPLFKSETISKDSATFSQDVSLSLLLQQSSTYKEAQELSGLLKESTSVITRISQNISTLSEFISNLNNSNSFAPMDSAAFITFNSILGANLALQTVNHQQAPIIHSHIHHADVVWDNMFIPRYMLFIRTILFRMFIGTLIIFWGIPVTLVSSLASLDALVPLIGQYWIYDLPPLLLGFIQGVLPSILVSLLIQALLRLLITTSKWEGKKRHSDIQLSIMDKYYAFLLFNILFVVTLANGAINAIGPIIERPSSAIDLLAQSLPKVSTFFITFLLYQALVGLPLELISPFSSVVQYFSKKGWVAHTPRGTLSREIMVQPIWGWIWPNHTLILTIGLVYSIIAPAIIFFVVLYFAVAYIVTTYKILHVFQTSQENDSGGLFYMKALQQTFGGIYLFQFTALGIISLNKQIGPAIISGAAIAFTVIAQNMCNYHYSSLMTQVPISTLIKLNPAPKTNHPAFDYYRHPSLLSSDSPVSIWLPDITPLPKDKIFVYSYIQQQLQFIQSLGIQVIVGEAELNLKRKELVVPV